MAGCDDHLVFSNHSPREKIVKFYTDDMILDKVLASNGQRVAEQHWYGCQGLRVLVKFRDS